MFNIDFKMFYSKKLHSLSILDNFDRFDNLEMIENAFFINIDKNY